MLTNPYRDIESEKEFLCSLIIEPELVYKTNVTTHDFTNPVYSDIYAAMLQMFSDGIALNDVKALHDNCNGKVELSTILKLVREAFTSANIRYHENRIKEASFNRKSKELLERLNNNIGQDDFIKEAECGIMELYDFSRVRKYQAVPEILSIIRKQIAESKKNKEYGIATGFPTLDRSIIGLCPRHLVVLGAYTSYGKSTFLSQMISNVCKAGHSVVVFSVEDSKEDKLIRLMATEASVPIYDIVTGRIEPDRQEFAENQIESYDLAVYDDVYTLEEMDMKIRKHKMQNSVDIVAVDFVQNIQAKGDGIYDRMSEVAIRLQQMAKRHNVNVFALSQVSAEEKGAIKLRGAQELASAADMVLWIDRDAQNEKREFSLIVRKNRPFGKTGKILMTFNELWTNIKEVYSE